MLHQIACNNASKPTRAGHMGPKRPVDRNPGGRGVIRCTELSSIFLVRSRRSSYEQPASTAASAAPSSSAGTK